VLNTLAIGTSLGFGIFVSPEVLIIGLLLASDRSHPQANTFGYFLGSAVGIALLLCAGYFLTHAATPTHPSGFARWLRVIFGGGLVLLGIHTLWKQRCGKKEKSKRDHQETGLGAKLMKLLPVSEEPRPGSPLPSLAICTGLSFLLTVAHVKTVGLAISAGHALHAAPNQAALLTALAGFLGLALFPTLVPFGLAIFHPETAAKARQISQAVAEKHGGWILAIILLLIGLDFLHGALGE